MSNIIKIFLVIGLLIFTSVYAKIPNITGIVNIIPKNNSFLLIWDKVYDVEGNPIETYKILIATFPVDDYGYYEEFKDVIYNSEGVEISKFGEKNFEKDKLYYFSIIALRDGEKSDNYSVEVKGKLLNQKINSNQINAISEFTDAGSIKEEKKEEIVGKNIENKLSNTTSEIPKQEEQPKKQEENKESLHNTDLIEKSETIEKKKEKKFIPKILPQTGSIINNTSLFYSLLLIQIFVILFILFKIIKNINDSRITIKEIQTLIKSK